MSLEVVVSTRGRGGRRVTEIPIPNVHDETRMAKSKNEPTNDA